MEAQQAKAIIESLLLVADRPITAHEISKVLDDKVDRRGVEALLKELMEEYDSRTLHLTNVAKGYQLCTRSEYGAWVRRFVQDARRNKLSRSALETLAIIAYKQPMTRAEIEYLRGGVDASGVLRTLLERRLAKILGRKQVPGRPVMYGTDQEFLLYFGLRDLTELPTLSEFVEQDDRRLPQEEKPASIEVRDGEHQDASGDEPVENAVAEESEAAAEGLAGAEREDDAEFGAVEERDVNDSEPVGALHAEYVNEELARASEPNLEADSAAPEESTDRPQNSDAHDE